MPGQERCPGLREGSGLGGVMGQSGDGDDDGHDHGHPFRGDDHALRGGCGHHGVHGRDHDAPLHHDDRGLHDDVHDAPHWESQLLHQHGWSLS